MFYDDQLLESFIDIGAIRIQERFILEFNPCVTLISHGVAISLLLVNSYVNGTRLSREITSITVHIDNLYLSGNFYIDIFTIRNGAYAVATKQIQLLAVIPEVFLDLRLCGLIRLASAMDSCRLSRKGHLPTQGPSYIFFMFYALSILRLFTT